MLQATLFRRRLVWSVAAEVASASLPGSPSEVGRGRNVVSCVGRRERWRAARRMKSVQLEGREEEEEDSGVQVRCVGVQWPAKDADASVSKRRRSGPAPADCKPSATSCAAHADLDAPGEPLSFGVPHAAKTASMSVAISLANHEAVRTRAAEVQQLETTP